MVDVVNLEAGLDYVLESLVSESRREALMGGCYRAER
jgi:hypothetical protein